jgi:hypothetical protein
MHLALSQSATITWCNADRPITPADFLSLSLSLEGGTLACRKLKVRDVTSGTVGLPRPPQKLHINESVRKEAPRPYRRVIYPLSTSPSLPVFPAFFSPLAMHFAMLRGALRGDVGLPIKFLPILPRPRSCCRFMLSRGNDPPVIIDSA